MSIAGLDPNVPSDTAFAGLGDDEIRALKAALVACFPNLDGLIEEGAGNGGPNAAAFTALFDRVAALEGTTVTGLVPVGAVMAWHGAVNAVPTGWALCDGTNGTPNLSDRFIYGTTSSSYDSTVAPETGGSVGSGTTGPATPSTATIPDHNLTVDNLPEHRHLLFNTDFPNVTANPPNSPNTGLSSSTQATYGNQSGNNDAKYYIEGTGTEATIGRSSLGGGVSSPTPVTHGTVDISHTHDLTGALPPYYKLAYIMFTG